MSNPTPILNNINAFDATKGTTISFNIIGGTDIVRSNIVYIYDLSTNDLICTHLYISTESIHELPPNTDSSIVYASGKSSADFVNNKNYYLQIQTFTNTAGTAGGSGMSVAKTFWCLFNPALSVNTIPAAISTTSYNFGATYTTNITDVTIPVTNIIQQYKFDLYTATGTLVQTSGNIIGSGEQEGTSTTYNITYNFSGLVVNNSYYVVVTTTSTEGMTVSAQSNTFTVSIDTPTVGGAIVNNNACDGYISVVSNLSDEYGGSASGEMASFETDSVNNVSSLKVNMEPIQDLHGYDKPWVGGAGSNKWDEVWELGWISSTGDNRDSSEIIRSKNYIPVTPNTTYCIVVPASTDIVYFDDNKVAIGNTDKNGLGDTDRTANTRTTHDNCHYIRFWTRNQTTYNHDIAINYPSTVTTYSPYENICPISGRTEVVTQRTGVNIWDEEWEVGQIYQGVPSAHPECIRSKNFCECVPNATYYVCCVSATNQYFVRLYFYDENKEWVGASEWSSNLTATTPANAYYFKISTQSANSAKYGNTYKNDISINYPSTDHEYHAYVGNDYTQDIEVTYTPTVQENEPYQFKRTGDVGGDRETIELVGGTVAWNQLVQNGDFAEQGVWQGNSYTVSDNIAKITTNDTSLYFYQSISTSVGHKYLFSVDAKSDANFNATFSLGSQVVSAPFTVTNSWKNFSAVINNTTGSVNANILRSTDGSLVAGTQVYVKEANIFDLTALFNPTIADYIYSLEQSQAGAGVAWFRRYFPKDYYPYDPGTLRSVEGVSAHETVGFNQWDEEWENGWWNYQTGVFTVSSSFFACKSKIAVFPNTEYYWKCPTNVRELQYYDANGEPLGSRFSYAEGYANTTFTTPDGCYYLTFYFGASYGTTYNHDICINLSDPSRNGEYEPYTKHTYPLDSSLTLRGVPKLVDGKLEFDGDIYPPSGEVQRRYGIVDLGTLNWTYNGGHTFYVRYLSMKAFSEFVTPKYVYIGRKTDAQIINADDKSIAVSAGNGDYILVKDLAYDNASTFKTAMSGTYLVYEKATPTTETAEPFTNPQVVDNGGTEAYVTTGIVPVGHDTTYLTRDIFGGTLDLVTGVLTVDRKMVTFDGSSDEVWTWEATNHQVYTAMHSMKRVPNYQGYMFSDVFKTIPNSDVGTVSYPTGVTGYKTTSSYEGQNWIYLRNIEWESRASFISWITENPVQVCYPLATPQTYQLTPHQIQTLVGQNNVWSDAGDVEVTFNLPITNLLVKRQDTSDTGGKWLTLYSQPITQASDMDFTYIDFLNQHGKTYRYALVPLLTQQQGDIDVEIEGGYTVSDDVLSVFDGVFVANSNGSQKLKAATEYGDLETNQDVGVLTTIGGKYPFVVSNSNLNYHSGSISALIVPSDFYTNGDLDRLDIVERREAIEKFLTDKTAKILKDWNGNIWLITFVENVEVSFVDDYGMGLGTLSAKWVEIGDVNDQTDLKQTGLI